MSSERSMEIVRIGRQLEKLANSEAPVSRESAEDMARSQSPRRPALELFH